MSNRVDCQPAFVLHSRPYRETSLLLDCLTEDQGRIGLIAKGAHRPKSPFAGILQPFIPLEISYLGGGELKTLAQAEPTGPCLRLQGARLASGLYMNEICVRLLLPQAAVPELFAVYRVTAEYLASDKPLATGLRLFEKELLSALGHDLWLTHDKDQAPLDPSAHYLYDLELGPYRVSLDAVPAGIAGLIAGQSLLSLAAGDLSDPLACKQAQSLLQSVIKKLLGGKPIYSRQLLR